MKQDCGYSITFRVPGSTTATDVAVVVLVRSELPLASVLNELSFLIGLHRNSR